MWAPGTAVSPLRMRSQERRSGLIRKEAARDRAALPCNSAPMRDDRVYRERVNRVLDYVAGNLDGDLSLDTLARVAGFSRFHFHRIFQSVAGETLNSHVRRVRLERAAQLMRAAPGRRLTDVALEVGFAGLAEFSRAFKAHFGLSASAWDRRSALENSKISKAPDGLTLYAPGELDDWARGEKVRARLVQLTQFTYAYVRTFEPYGNMRLVAVYQGLIAWLAERGTDVADVVIIGMSLDDPSITPSERCRYDLGVAFPAGAGASGLLEELTRARGRTPGAALPPARAERERHGLSVREIGPLQAVSVHCTGDLAHVERAWQLLYSVWLPASPYVPSDEPAMEVFVRLPEEIGWDVFDLHVCVPVERP